jgi:glycosyltransferase involved in cell wall biosynthesis
MHVTVLVPDVHDRPTGGTIYNRRVIAGLERHGPVEVAGWCPEEEPSPSLDAPGDAVVLVDSLLVRHKTPIRTLRSAHPTATFVLLAHYLHCIDPSETDAPAATTERAVLPCFDGVIATSPYAKQALVGEGVPEARIDVAPPGLDESYRAPTSDRSGQDVPRLLTVANLQPGKGLRTLVAALSMLSELPWRWTLVGDDTLAQNFAASLYEQVRASPIDDRITMLGRVSPTDLRAQYDRADAFVLPSRFETCSMATREAMARGLPVVATNVGGLPDNFGDAVAVGDAPAPDGSPAARLVPPDDPDALARLLRTLLADSAMRKEMGTAARERSRTFPTWTETAEHVRSILQRLAASTTGREGTS